MLSRFHKLFLLGAVCALFVICLLSSNTLAVKNYVDPEIGASPAQQTDSPSASEPPHLNDDDAHAQDVVGLANSTLGFQKIVYLNVPNRYNLDDTMAMQSALSGIKMERYLGVSIDSLKDEGLPPSSRDEPMVAGVRACYRSHANIWRKMLEEGLESVLVLEADAVWDVNLRHIFYHFGQGLEQLMRNQTVLKPGEHATAQDPYLHNHWDVIQFGGCYANSRRKEISVQYYDPYAPPGMNFFGDEIKPNRRVVRWRAGEVCTVSYAVSRAGALKLLLRTAIDMNEPVDLTLAIMIESGGLDAYSVFPVVFDQWQYKDSLGLGSKNSDIRGPDETGEDGAGQDAEGLRKLWAGLHDTLDVWTSRFPENSRFRLSTLNNLKSFIFEGRKTYDAEIDKVGTGSGDEGDLL